MHPCRIWRTSNNNEFHRSRENFSHARRDGAFLGKNHRCTYRVERKPQTRTYVGADSLGIQGRTAHSRRPRKLNSMPAQGLPPLDGLLLRSPSLECQPAALRCRIEARETFLLESRQCTSFARFLDGITWTNTYYIDAIIGKPLLTAAWQ